MQDMNVTLRTMMKSVDKKRGAFQESVGEIVRKERSPSIRDSYLNILEDQPRANERLPLLIAVWPGRCIACLEPLLGRIDLSPWLHALDWVVTGGETGAGDRQADPKHLRVVRDQCVAAGVPLFFMQWAGRMIKRLKNTVVSLIAKSSCGGVKADTIFNGEARVNIDP